MPRYYEEEDDKAKKSKPACSGIMEDLVECLWKSDCVKIQRKTPRQCLLVKDDPTVDECQNLRYAFFECRRSIIDMRTRFRGRKGY